MISTGQLVTEEFYTLGKLVQLGFGTNNYDGNTTLCMASAVSGYKRSFGSDGPPGRYEDLEKADVILLIGANIAENHPILCQHLGANPRQDADRRRSARHQDGDDGGHLSAAEAALRPGAAQRHRAHSDSRRPDRSRLHRRATPPASRNCATFLEAYTPERVARNHRASSDDLIEQVAMLYGRAKAGFIGWTMGVNHSTQGTETVNAINNLALLTGNIGRAGASPFSITGQCNAMGTREAGFTSSLPGYRKFEIRGGSRGTGGALEHRRQSAFPPARGLAYPDIIEAAVAQEDSRAVDHRHQSAGLLSQSRRAAAGASRSRFPGGAGRLSSHAHHRTGRPGAARRDLGREGRHLHQLRTPRQQGEPRGGAARRSAIRISTSSSAVADKLGVPRGTVPRLDSGRATRSTNGGAFRAGRLCDYSAHDAGSEIEARSGGMQWGGDARSTPTASSRRADGRAKLFCASSGSRFPEQPEPRLSRSF